MEDGATLEAGTQFVIEGLNLNRLPEETILSYTRSYLQQALSWRHLKMVAHTSTTATFEVIATHTFTATLTARILSTPFEPPRTEIDYETI